MRGASAPLVEPLYRRPAMPADRQRVVWRTAWGFAAAMALIGIPFLVAVNAILGDPLFSRTDLDAVFDAGFWSFIGWRYGHRAATADRTLYCGGDDG